ncbi:NUMOD3 domain-containing DNA-binding protein [Pseudoduganella sp. UC29_106]|uniref:NUMOD3 domain-containing DNA-binding protein n=1 Tax=Pseudoduganella sp. UC29_106 TaxID=3374553 RepID=UPI003757957B
MDSGIYEILNSVNGKRYVGSAKNFRLRWKAHLLHLNRGTHHSRHLQSAWVKHGAEAFRFNKLLICEAKDLIFFEQRAFDAFKPEYNIAPIAGSCLGVKHSEETKQKLRVVKLGNQHTLGYRHTPEAIEKLRAKQTGVESPTKGKPRNPEAAAKTANAHRGMKRSDETRARISKAMAGKKRAPKTDETKAKLSVAMKARPPNPERVAKMASTKRGSKLTPEHKAKIGAASRAAWALRKKKD